MNRAARRKNKKKPVYHKETQQEIADRLLRTGEITLNDLKQARKEAYEQGKKDGIRHCTDFQLPYFFASVGCALHNIHGFAGRRIAAIYNEAALIMMEEITAQDMVNRCKWETGLDVTKHIKEYEPF
jgi:hypothetical protein